MTKITLEQWRVFVATARHGSFHQAAERLSKTQSAVSHAVRKMEECLGQELFAIEGRRATLTKTGEMIFPRARELIGHATQIEHFCSGFDPSSEGEITAAIDIIFPKPILLNALHQYSLLYPRLSVRVCETALSGASEAFEEGRAQIGIASYLPGRIVAEPLLSVRFICVAAAGHPLHQLGLLTHELLKDHRQVVMSDSGLRGADSGWLGSRQRWTVSHLTTSVALVADGQGYAWLPEHCIRDELASGRLRPLNLAAGRSRIVQLNIGYGEHLEQVRQILDLVAIFRDAVQDSEPPTLPTMPSRIDADCGRTISSVM
ncbi:LysR family transcriptional regulator [Methylosinus sp. H3A]|nr:LysR family transcriptional regulator [Methylosinus sp. H3A]